MAALVVVVAGALVAVWFVQRHTPAVVSHHTGQSGSIVYEALAPDRQTRLYRWDLDANVVHRGPVVDKLVGLFDASRAHPGWIGETSVAPEGGVDIGVFKFLGPADVPVPLGHGAVAGWAAGGADATVGTMIHDAPGCRQLSILSIHLSPLRQDEIAGERVCATLHGVAMGSLQTYVSLQEGQDSRISQVSVSRLRSVLDHAQLVSISPANDMIITPAASTASTSLPGAELYYRGPASQPATPYTYGDAPLVLDRVLAWAPFGTEALVLGSAGGRTGFFRLPAAPPEGPTQPAIYVGPATGYSDGLYAAVTGFVFTDGHFSRVSDGSTTSIPLPPGAPVPTGPMVWTRA